MNRAIEPNWDAPLLERENTLALALYPLSFYAANHSPSIGIAYPTKFSQNGWVRIGDTLLLCRIQWFMEASTTDNGGIVHWKCQKTNMWEQFSFSTHTIYSGTYRFQPFFCSGHFHMAYFGNPDKPIFLGRKWSFHRNDPYRILHTMDCLSPMNNSNIWEQPLRIEKIEFLWISLHQNFVALIFLHMPHLQLKQLWPIILWIDEWFLGSKRVWS